MLPLYPQSITSVLLDSLKAYKKIFFPVLPISVVIGITQVIPLLMRDFLAANSGSLLAKGIVFLFIFVGILCTCWGMCFVYNTLATENFDYKTSFIKAAANFLKVILLSLIAVVIIDFILGGGIYLSTTSAGSFLNSVAMRAFLVIAFALILPSALTFGIIYVFEVLIKSAGILVAMKKATKIALSKKAFLRALWFMLLFMLVGMISITIIFVLNLINMRLKSIVPNEIIGILASLFIFPLNIIILVNFYYDLTLRLEG